MGDSPLTPEEKALVTGNWDLVKKNPVKNGVGLFMTFFKMYPKYQNNFKFRDVPLDKLAEDTSLKRHATGVFAALTSLIDNLDDMEVLVSLLEGIGERHGKRKIPEEAFDHLTTAVIETLRQGLGDLFTEEAEQAWKKTLDVSMGVIKASLTLD